MCTLLCTFTRRIYTLSHCSTPFPGHWNGFSSAPCFFSFFENFGNFFCACAHSYALVHVFLRLCNYDSFFCLFPCFSNFSLSHWNLFPLLRKFVPIFLHMWTFFCDFSRFSAFVSLQHIFSAHIHVFLTAPRLFFCIGSFFTHLHFCNVFDSFCNYVYAWAHFIAFVLLQLVQLHVVLPPPRVFCA